MVWYQPLARRNSLFQQSVKRELPQFSVGSPLRSRCLFRVSPYSLVASIRANHEGNRSTLDSEKE